MTDHKKAANRAIQSVHEETAPEWSAVWAAEAQAHATLYLAEQQRMANLIALSQAQDGNGWQATEPLEAIYAYDNSEMDAWGDNGLRIRSEIREGLGLA